MSTSPDAPAHGHLRMGSLSLRSLSPEATCPTGPLERIWLLQAGAGLLPRVEAWLTGRGWDVGGLGAAARDPPPCRGTGRRVSAGGAREATRQDEQLPARVLRRCADASSTRTLLGVGADGPPASRGYCSPQCFPQGLWSRSRRICHTSAPGGHPCSAGPTAPGPGSPCGWADAGTGPCPHRQYYWYDERGKKVKCTAPQYVDFVMSSVQKLVTDEDVFPTKYGACLPAASSRWPQLRRGGQPRDPGCRARPMPSGRGPPGLGQEPPPSSGTCGQMWADERSPWLCGGLDRPGGGRGARAPPLWPRPRSAPSSIHQEA